ncbi:hypothetical protein ACULLL_18800 [Lysinibacillus irui]|uniref:hypothetical protein n=1 Tax=Lysinibacillus irui TaxID=2998077 RepID=UPI0040442717
MTNAKMPSNLSRAFEFSGLSLVQFKDVTTNGWAYRSFQVLVKNEVVFGFQMGCLNQNNIKRSRIYSDDGEGIG